jgi:hypothetical protein
MDESNWENETYVHTNDVLYISTNTNSWHYELKHCLQHGSSPTYLDARKRRDLRP